jgi:hypothetical protein
MDPPQRQQTNGPSSNTAKTSGSSFRGATITGHNNLQGNSNGTPGDWEKASIRGNCNVQGQHDNGSAVASAIAESIKGSAK